MTSPLVLFLKDHFRADERLFILDYQVWGFYITEDLKKGGITLDNLQNIYRKTIVPFCSNKIKIEVDMSYFKQFLEALSQSVLSPADKIKIRELSHI